MGRMPVIAPPTPRPVMPASEMGVSITREVPNSSTRPESTLNGVPASATSSPMMNTRGSRRISSAKASRMACPSVITRASCLVFLAVILSIDIFIYLAWIWIRSVESKLFSRFDFGSHALLDLLKRLAIGHSLCGQPVYKQFQRVALCLPVLFLFFGAVVGSLDITDMMSHITVCIAKHEARSLATTSALDQP